MVALAVAPEYTADELQQRRHELERRLSAGWRRIDEAIVSGRDVHAWEEHWIILLGEYERICDALRASQQ